MHWGQTSVGNCPNSHYKRVPRMVIGGVCSPRPIGQIAHRAPTALAYELGICEMLGMAAAPYCISAHVGTGLI